MSPAKKTGRKPTIADKVARERRLPQATGKEATGPDYEGELTVGDIFHFSSIERALITMAVTEYDKRCKATRNNLVDLQGSVVDIDTIRGRSLLLQDVILKAGPEENVTLKHPLRVTLGSALSAHARWLRKEQDKAAGRVVDVDNFEDARDLTQSIGNKIGEQLVLYVQEDDEGDAKDTVKRRKKATAEPEEELELDS